MNLQRSFILALAVGSGWPVLAATADNPYEPIVTRNMFGLVPIPAVDPASLAPATPLPKITPNGTMTLFGKLQVLFKVSGVAVPGQPAKDDFYVMGEGERQDEITVQKIDEKSATITFNNHGTIQELALVAGKASSGTPAPSAPGMTMPTRPALPGVVPTAGGANPAIGFGGRFGRTRPAPGMATPSGGGGAPGVANASAGGTSEVNERGIYSPSAGEPMSPEARIIMMEAQREQLKQSGLANPNIVPPTPLTEQLNEDSGAAAQ